MGSYNGYAMERRSLARYEPIFNAADGDTSLDNGACGYIETTDCAGWNSPSQQIPAPPDSEPLAMVTELERIADETRATRPKTKTPASRYHMSRASCFAIIAKRMGTDLQQLRHGVPPGKTRPIFDSAGGGTDLTTGLMGITPRCYLQGLE